MTTTQGAFFKELEGAGLNLHLDGSPDSYHHRVLMSSLYQLCVQAITAPRDPEDDSSI